MKRAMMLLAVCGLTMAVGCEEKKAEAPKSMGDAVKSGMDKTADVAKDAAKSTADATKAAADKAKDTMAAAKDSVGNEAKTMVDAAKAKLDALTKSGSSLTPDKKLGFDAAVAPLNDQFKTLSDGVAKLKDMTPDAMTKSAADLKDKASKFMDNIKNVADKFGLKL